MKDGSKEALEIALEAVPSDADMAAGKSIDDQVRQIIAEQLSVHPSQVQDHAVLVDLGVDSLDLTEIILNLEATFSIQVPREDEDEWRTVSDVQRYIKGRK